MTNNEAIETIKSNWPPESYSLLREALTLAIDALNEKAQSSKGCRYYTINHKLPCCTHACDGCTWYV